MKIRVLRKSFAERNPVIIGVVVVAMLVISLVISLDIKHLPFMDSGRQFSAMFTESGGLDSGDEVQVSGLAVGTVSSVRLVGDRVRVSFEITDDAVRLGSRTSARVSTLTLLGKRGLTLDSAGSGTMRNGATIPDTRTTPPYNLTDALAELSTNTAAIDTASFAKALRTITAVLKKTPAPLGTTVRAVSKISETIASRDADITSLFAAANNVSGILDSRTAQIRKLLGDGTTLLTVINNKRATITTLLTRATALARELKGLVADNKADFGPALRQLSKAIGLLNENKKFLDRALDLAGPFAGSLGESVSSGPFFQSYVQNLLRPLELTGNGGN